MVRLIVLVASLMLLLPSAAPAAAPAAAELPRGSWSCVMLDPTHLALTGDYLEVQNELFRKRLVERRKASWARRIGWGRDLSFNFSGTEAIAAYRPKVTAMLNNRPAIGIASTSAAPEADLPFI